MKKVLLTVIVVLTMFFVIPSVNAESLPKKGKDPINVYIFRGETCSYCHSALEFFQNAQEKYGDYFKLIGFEVSDKGNADLWKLVGDHFGDEVSGVPYIVIGDAYHNSGFSEEMGEEMIAAILSEYKNSKHTDVVNDILVEKKLDKKIKYEQNSEFSVLKNAQSQASAEAKEESNDTVIIIAIFVVLIGGIAGLVYASKK